MTTPNWGGTPDETPIDDASGLLVRGITTRRQLNQVEAAMRSLDDERPEEVTEMTRN